MGGWIVLRGWGTRLGKENSVILDNCIVDYLSAVDRPVTLSDSRKCGSRYDSSRDLTDYLHVEIPPYSLLV